MYYEIILDPMDLSMIKRRLQLQRGGYKAWQDVFVDLDIMFANALHFNEPDSQVCTNALHFNEPDFQVCMCERLYTYEAVLTCA